MSIDYAVYCGDELLFIGTRKECMERFSWKKGNFHKLSSPKWVADNGDKGRTVVIRLEDDEE
ncbi:hypothetical protein SDC9_154469 [bioreactor metagenome]|uniref:Uncharacterized protein n=1 Tax=bioreactor metagenome TaxID=1076179 RepID=A0A645F3Q0_9ZZZZ